MMIGTSESDRIVRHTSRPETSGSMRSRITRDGGSVRKRSSARRPSGATETEYPSRSRLYRTESASDSSSSTTRIRVPSGCIRGHATGMGRVGELAELARDQERDLLADVDGVVAHALERTGGQVHVHAPFQRPRLVRELGDLEVHVAVQPVDRIVHLRQPQAELEVATAQRVQG